MKEKRVEYLAIEGFRLYQHLGIRILIYWQGLSICKLAYVILNSPSLYYKLPKSDFSFDM
uniref:Uncharacterized protein n=1 Tax=Rhizophagus irregularis (strain DAOM 181602 / DAOM 197198 / MUCL 43194) TaxID=747089 RepID=U9SYJ1_RHIID